MKLPKLMELNQSKENTEEFLGYDHNLRTQTGEWFDAENMTADFYPAASPRKKRSIQYKIDKTPFADTGLYFEPLSVGMTYDSSTLIMLRNIVDENGVFRGAWFTNNNKPYLAEDFKSVVINKESEVSLSVYGYTKNKEPGEEDPKIFPTAEWRDVNIKITKPDGTVITYNSLFKHFKCHIGQSNSNCRAYYDVQTEQYAIATSSETSDGIFEIKKNSRLSNVYKSMALNVDTATNTVTLSIILQPEASSQYNVDAFARYIVKTGLKIKDYLICDKVVSTISFEDGNYLAELNTEVSNEIIFTFFIDGKKYKTRGNEILEISSNSISLNGMLEDNFIPGKNNNFYSEVDNKTVNKTTCSVTTKSSKIVDEIADKKMRYFLENDKGTDLVNGYKRSIVRNASYICTFPDGVVYETKNKTELVPVKKINVKNINTSDDENSGFRTLATLRTVIENGADNLGYSVINFGKTVHRLVDDRVQEYNSENAMWVDIPSYVMLSYAADTDEDPLFKDINEGDVVNISISPENENESAEYSFSNISGMVYFDGNEVKFLENLKVIKKGDGRIEGEGFASKDKTTVKAIAQPYIILSGEKNYILVEDSEGKKTGLGHINVFNKDAARGGTITIERRMPDICLACESGNRIWGCSNSSHEIYASALGNPYVFYDYSGLSTDSYAVTVGTDGEWTGCINYRGYPYFFKETSMTVISGRYPEEYSVLTYTDFMGVERGSEKSLAVINGILYYKSRLGVTAFDGSSTVLISSNLGQEHYKNAVAGALGNKYYISMEDDFGKRSLFVYDIAKGMWMREDDVKALQYLNVDNHLLFSTENAVMNTTAENALNTAEYEIEGDFNWFCETGTYGYSYPNNKYLTRFQIRMEVEKGSRAEFFIQYNSSGAWIYCGEMYGQGIRSYLFAIRPCRCDHMKLKIKGRGRAKLYSIAKIFEEGGDVNA